MPGGAPASFKRRLGVPPSVRAAPLPVDSAPGDHMETSLPLPGAPTARARTRHAERGSESGRRAVRCERFLVMVMTNTAVAEGREVRSGPTAVGFMGNQGETQQPATVDNPLFDGNA
jgi:hypothetical protein